jgi:hypothetical protein
MDLDWSTLKTTSGMSGTFLAGLRLSGALALGCDLWAVGSGHAHQARPGQQPTLARAGRAARWWERPAYALDAPPIAVRAGGGGLVLGTDWVLTGKQSTHEARRPDARRDGSAAR